MQRSSSKKYGSSFAGGNANVMAFPDGNINDSDGNIDSDNGTITDTESSYGHHQINGSSSQPKVTFKRSKNIPNQ